MGTIAAFLESSVFEPQDIEAMSMALNDVCKALKLDGDARAKEIIAACIIDLARRSERNSTKLRDHLLEEAGEQERMT